MSFKVEMPEVQNNASDKDSLKPFVPYLVYDSEDDMYSTIMTINDDDDGDIIWFDSDGWIGGSSLDYLKNYRFTIIREYQKGDQLIITKQ